nr:hypothetical protein [Zoogloeaceae bacterium]
MKLRPLVLALVLPCVGGCLNTGYLAPVAGTIGAIGLAADDFLETEYLSAALVAYAIYDPLAPNWTIEVVPRNETRARIDMRLRKLITGGEGEARVVFMRNAQDYAEEQGFAGFEILRYEEGLESTRPFAQRYATGDIKLVGMLE